MPALFTIFAPRRAATPPLPVSAELARIVAEIDAGIIADLAAARDWPSGLDGPNIVGRLLGFNTDMQPAPTPLPFHGITGMIQDQGSSLHPQRA